MNNLKMTKEHLEKMYKNETILALQAHLFHATIKWVKERSEDPTPLTDIEKDVGDTALTLAGEIARLVQAS
jgi:hypothetical protein